MRLWPRSMLGQTLLAVAAALLVAQAVSAALLWRANEERGEAAMLNTAAFRLIAEPRDGSREGRGRDERGRGRLRQRLGGSDQSSHRPRSLRTETTPASPLQPGEIRDPDRERTLARILESQGVEIGELVVTARRAGADPFLRERAGRRGLQRLGPGWPDRTLLVAGLKRGGSDTWRVARVVTPGRDPAALRTVIIQTLVIYLVLVGILAVLLRRITRPLATLTGRVERFASTQEAGDPLTPQGPSDIRNLIEAHNAMESRIAALLDEKDIMLGAIGHDLKTPLAALRVRIESVENETERARMAGTIEDITRSLDDILSLARVGRIADAPERTELASLVASVVEEFEDMDRDVTIAASSRIVAPIHITWLRRGLRNLISNALRYAGAARVSLLQDDAQIILRIDDDGPGIPSDRIAEMLEPFTRGETSRNRETGGAGLGLTLARAIAERHGGELVLTNRDEGGLRAEIRLPTD